jgi:hypothetical protein
MPTKEKTNVKVPEVQVGEELVSPSNSSISVSLIFAVKKIAKNITNLFYIFLIKT